MRADRFVPAAIAALIYLSACFFISPPWWAMALGAAVLTFGGGFVMNVLDYAEEQGKERE